jgi:hypothetical protein
MYSQLAHEMQFGLELIDSVQYGQPPHFIVPPL